MGFYIETGTDTDKAKVLIDQYPQQITSGGALTRFSDVPDGKTAVCVVSNPWFEAAGIAYDSDEFEAFSEPNDLRPKTWLLMDTDLAEQLCTDYAKYRAKVN